MYDRMTLGVFMRNVQAWLGFYNSHLRKLGWKQPNLVQNATIFALQVCNQTEVPALQASCTLNEPLSLRPSICVHAVNTTPLITKDG